MGTTLVHSNLFSYYLFLHRSPFRSAPRDNDGYTSILSQFQLCLWQRWEHCNFSRYSLFPRRSTPLRVPIPFRSVCACNDIENLFLFNSISISSSRSAPFRSVQSETVRVCFILFHSVSFCFVLFRSVSFCFVLFRSVSFCFIPFHSIPFHSPFRSAPFVHVMI
jgi:hypothetical protein